MVVVADVAGVVAVVIAAAAATIHQLFRRGHCPPGASRLVDRVYPRASQYGLPMSFAFCRCGDVLHRLDGMGA